MRVLAIQLKRIGDLALTTPALRALHEAGHTVTLLLAGNTAGLLPALEGAVDESIVYRRGASHQAWRQLLSRRRFDAVIDFTGRERSALLSLAARSPLRVVARPLLRGSWWRHWGYNRPVDTSLRARHTVDFYLDHLAPLGVPIEVTGEAAGPVLRVPAPAAARAGALLAAAGVPDGAPFVVVHPGTARPEKFWMPERWAEIVDHCRGALGLPVVLTGGAGDPYEQAHLARLRAALQTVPSGACTVAGDRAPLIDLAGRLDLLELCAVLSRAGLVLGVDSGPMHLAAAFGRPQVVLFGPTNPFHWRPRHGRALVLRGGHGQEPLVSFHDRSPGGPTEAISTEAVIACISQLLAAGPPP